MAHRPTVIHLAQVGWPSISHSQQWMIVILRTFSNIVPFGIRFRTEPTRYGEEGDIFDIFDGAVGAKTSGPGTGRTDRLVR